MRRFMKGDGYHYWEGPDRCQIDHVTRQIHLTDHLQQFIYRDVAGRSHMRDP
jgi:hypothetical protein